MSVVAKVKTTTAAGGQTVLTEAGVAMGSQSETKTVS